MARIFTLEEARALLPQVQRLTRPVFDLATSLAEELHDREARGEPGAAEALRERLSMLMESWAASVRDLGPDVKGLWLVDFDSGDGYWCWAWPEEVLDHWHSYAEGFQGRIPVELKPEPWPR